VCGSIVVGQCVDDARQATDSLRVRRAARARYTAGKLYRLCVRKRHRMSPSSKDVFYFSAQRQLFTQLYSALEADFLSVCCVVFLGGDCSAILNLCALVQKPTFLTGAEHQQQPKKDTSVKTISERLEPV